MSNRRQLMLASLGTLAAQLVAAPARSQDATKVMPRAYRVVLENKKVRVIEFTGRPGMGICGEGMHSHPEHLAIVMSDWQGVASTPDSDPVARQRKFGDVFWSEPVTHKVENTGKTNSRVLIVELKGPAKEAA